MSNVITLGVKQYYKALIIVYQSILHTIEGFHKFLHPLLPLAAAAVMYKYILRQNKLYCMKDVITLMFNEQGTGPLQYICKKYTQGIAW